MTMRAALLMSCALLVTATPALAGIHDILIGLDEKVAYDANGSVNAAPGNDAVLIVDVSNPAKPKIRARSANQPPNHPRREARPGGEFGGDEPGRHQLEDRSR
jgi:hypothetical protein